MTRYLLFLCALVCAAPCVQAATAADVIAEVDRSLTSEEHDESGNTARATALAALLHDELGLIPSEVVELRLACAGAWVEASRVMDARELLKPLLVDVATTPTVRERAGLLWVATWQAEWRTAEKPGDIPAVITTMTSFPALGPNVTARMYTAEAARIQAMDTSTTGAEAALQFFDRALDVLKNATPAQRVPIFALRIAAMERAHMSSADVQAWFQKRAQDPAAAQAMETALTASQKQLGFKAPPLQLPRIDGQTDTIDLQSFRGKAVLIDFFATWCAPCADHAAAIVQIAHEMTAHGVITIAVSLDTKDSVKDLPAWIARYGITYPIIGERAGWDGETDDAWHVDSIPCLILVGPDGTVIANNVLSTTTEETVATIRKALEQTTNTSEKIPSPDAAIPEKVAPASDFVP